MYYWLCFIVLKHPFYSHGQETTEWMGSNIWIHKQICTMSPDTRVQIEDSAHSGRGFFKNVDEFRRNEGVLGVEKRKGRIFREGFGYVCVHGKRRRILIHDYVCVYFCVPCKVCVFVCTLYHITKTILRGSSACISLCKNEQLVSPVGVISSEAHPFVTHPAVCPSPLSSTSGPIMSPLHTWLFFLLLSDFKAPLDGCSHRNWAR